ncbi:MAG TPA: hypothetical protein IAC74_07230 [Candidatus Aphodoplasma excrementigallinarum]|uniref:Zinc-ribbon domain-containing protein n=1 Tax=Candidatus Aphodoplasma excrementigallinarum TaxID=2840673 RepID=A0A9D1NIT7_9FIRM|nr:hypothetical protein [Candidatus Aphodoplasma excrementigallinarum]
MRKCNNCNREFDDSVDFCPTCGARLGDGPVAFDQQAAAAQIQPDQQAAQPPVPQPAPAARPANSDPVTVGEWMVMLVNLIPCVGPIIYFIIMLVWAFGDNTKPSKKSFAKANLIIYLVAIGIIVLIVLFSMIVGVSIASVFDNPYYYYYY